MNLKDYFDTNPYHFGLNGKENDSETGTQDYGMRIYNPGLGRFLSVDPLFKDYPWNSTYSFGENDLIRCIDLDGLEKSGYENRMRLSITGGQTFGLTGGINISMFGADIGISASGEAVKGETTYHLDFYPSSGLIDPGVFTTSAGISSSGSFDLAIYGKSKSYESDINRFDEDENLGSLNQDYHVIETKNAGIGETKITDYKENDGESKFSFIFSKIDVKAFIGFSLGIKFEWEDVPKKTNIEEVKKETNDSSKIKDGNGGGMMLNLDNF